MTQFPATYRGAPVNCIVEYPDSDENESKAIAPYEPPPPNLEGAAAVVVIKDAEEAKDMLKDVVASLIQVVETVACTQTGVVNSSSSDQDVQEEGSSKSLSSSKPDLRAFDEVMENVVVPAAEAGAKVAEV